VASDAEKNRKTRRRQMVLVGGLLLFALLIRINLRQGQIYGDSMEPNFHNGSTVLVWKTASTANLQPGDVIIFRDKKGDELIKRIAFIRKQWQPESPTGFYAHPNGGRLIPYSILFDDYFKRVKAGKTLRPAAENSIYVLGDNLVDSDDSRNFGPISPQQILGKVVP
jgi:signal peptidase I